MKLYQQLPLSADKQYIRLIELDPGTDLDNDVHAKVDTHDLQNDMDYVALSYAWGPQDDSAYVKLNDESFPVSQNLLAAIKQIRLVQRQRGKSTKLWIDSICINQLDNEEKSRQVMLMKEIYNHAAGVVAWVGEQDDLTALSFDTLERFSVDDGTLDGSATYRDLLDTKTERTEAIQRFIERPYFIRMWIIQEIVVAKETTIVCGSYSLDFDRMQMAIRRMTGSGFFPLSTAILNIVYVANWRASFIETNASAGRPENEDLDLRLFLDSRDRLATDPRDKIYSLRGIVNKKIAHSIQVDYNKSVEDVYTSFSKKILSIRPDLQILSAVIHAHKAISGLQLPSYVPDWTLPKYGGGILQRYYRFKPECLFRAAGSTPTGITTSESSDVISIEGIRLDTIKRIVDIKSVLGTKEDGSVSVNEAILRKLAADVITSDTYPFSDEPSWLAYFRTMTGDRTALSPRIDDGYRSQFVAAFNDWVLHHSAGKGLPDSVWEDISKGIGIIIEDKSVFITTQGYLGMGHEGLLEGDLVCIFHGGEVPFLLRVNAHEDNKVFKFLSECYVHGVMDGEAMNEPQRMPVEQFLIG
jgi:hypothetical protein